MSQTTVRRSTNVTLDASVVGEARAVKINISRASQEGIEKAVSDERARQWKVENRQAIAHWARDFEQNGLPLAKFRQF